MTTTNRIAITRISNIQCITCGEKMSPLADRCWSCYLVGTDGLTTRPKSHGAGHVFHSGMPRVKGWTSEKEFTCAGTGGESLPNDVAYQLTLVADFAFRF
jgi:hypothetical protein